MDNHFDGMKSRFDQRDKWFEESEEEIKKKNNQHLAGLQLQAQQLRLAAKVDLKQDMDTREHKEDTIANYERFGEIV